MKTVTLLFFLFTVSFCYGAVTPEPPAQTQPGLKLSVKEIERRTGTSFSFFQKIKLKILLRSVRKFNIDDIPEKQEKQASLSMILGLSSIGLLLVSAVPYLAFLSILALPAAVLAIIFGAKSLKGNSNSKGYIGIISGSITLAITLIAIIVLAIILAGGFQ